MIRPFLSLLPCLLLACASGSDKGGDDGSVSGACETLDSSPLTTADPPATTPTLASMDALTELGGTTTWSVACEGEEPATATLDAPGPAPADYVLNRYSAEFCGGDEAAIYGEGAMTIGGDSLLSAGTISATWIAWGYERGALLVGNQDGDDELRIWPLEGGGWEGHTEPLGLGVSCVLTLVAEPAE